MTKQKQIKDTEKQVKELEKSNSSIDKETHSLEIEQEKAEKPFQDKIDGIKNLFAKRINPLEKQRGTNKSTIHKLQKHIEDLGLEIEVDKSKKLKKHNETTIEALFKRLHLGDVGSFRDETKGVIEKKPLGNGIQIFRITDNWQYSIWLAFLGLKLVGLSYRRKGAHQGDETTPYSYIDGLRDKNLLYSFKESRYGGGKDKVNSTFTQWSVRLEKRKISALKGIKLDAKTINRIKSRESLDGTDWR